MRSAIPTRVKYNGKKQEPQETGFFQQYLRQNEKCLICRLGGTQWNPTLSPPLSKGGRGGFSFRTYAKRRNSVIADGRAISNVEFSLRKSCPCWVPLRFTQPTRKWRRYCPKNPVSVWSKLCRSLRRRVRRTTFPKIGFVVGVLKKNFPCGCKKVEKPNQELNRNDDF